MKARLQVLKHISGSHCVVEKPRPCGYCDHYIDARRHTDGISRIEVVRNGFVCFTEYVFDKHAPRRIIELAKEHLT
jgi:hypothetical protein